MPTDLWQPTASLTFSRTTRRLAEGLAAAVQVTIDGGVYDKVRAFHAPNSRHPKTGLHKRALMLDELTLSTSSMPKNVPLLSFFFWARSS